MSRLNSSFETFPPLTGTSMPGALGWGFLFTSGNAVNKITKLKLKAREVIVYTPG